MSISNLVPEAETKNPNFYNPNSYTPTIDNSDYINLDHEPFDLLLPNSTSNNNSDCQIMNNSVIAPCHYSLHTNNPIFSRQEMSCSGYTSACYSADDTIKESSTRSQMDAAFSVAFRTRTHLEILDDGYKWRKYGKKMVKSNPNPRHYYKCFCKGCTVKKKVERDQEDSSYLITTYEGKHNHETPFTIMPPFTTTTTTTTTNNVVASAGWTDDNALFLHGLQTEGWLP